MLTFDLPGEKHRTGAVHCFTKARHASVSIPRGDFEKKSVWRSRLGEPVPKKARGTKFAKRKPSRVVINLRCLEMPLPGTCALEFYDLKHQYPLETCRFSVPRLWQVRVLILRVERTGGSWRFSWLS